MPQTVLLVDDSIPLHKLVRAQLEAEPVEVHSAYDGEAALNAAVSLRPTLILLDVDMPELDGFEVCRRLKGNPLTASIPVIFLTANSLVGDKVRGFDTGGADYVTKPFKPEELRARVRGPSRQASAGEDVDGRCRDRHVESLVSGFASQSAALARPPQQPAALLPDD